MTALPRYAVTLDVLGETAVLNVPSLQGPDFAGRRAFWTAVDAGWGDVLEVRVVQVQPIAACRACTGSGMIVDHDAMRRAHHHGISRPDPAEHADECTSCAGTGRSTDPADGLDGLCNHCLEPLTEPDTAWCSVRCRAADVQLTPAGQQAAADWDAGR